tara:strand:- start:21802 stop:21981 length:180 start_codon:yes stop_codon:yes gene_type:complete
MGFYIGLAMALLPFLIFIFVLYKKEKLMHGFMAALPIFLGLLCAAYVIVTIELITSGIN